MITNQDVEAPDLIVLRDIPGNARMPVDAMPREALSRIGCSRFRRFRVTRRALVIFRPRITRPLVFTPSSSRERNPSHGPSAPRTLGKDLAAGERPEPTTLASFGSVHVVFGARLVATLHRLCCERAQHSRVVKTRTVENGSATAVPNRNSWNSGEKPRIRGRHLMLRPQSDRCPVRL